MIKTAMQLKAKIRNMSGGNPMKAQTLVRNYMMERFLERCSLSEYKSNLILKGGMFVASYVGLDTRATMDIDTTVKSIPLTLEKASEVIRQITDIRIDDGVGFEIKSVREIMEEHEYPGIRFMIDGYLEKLKQPIKIDLSAGDVITPSEISYSYPLMFEDRSISILSYNIETVLSEKMETILSRAEANTRMRDFYDVHVLLREKEEDISQDILQKSFDAVCNKRKAMEVIETAMDILRAVKESEELKRQWGLYKDSNYYVGNTRWSEAMESCFRLARMLKLI